jgi:hypothetical protein
MTDDDLMEATAGPQHGKFEAKAPEIEELKLRVESLQAQVHFCVDCSLIYALMQIFSYLRLMSVRLHFQRFAWSV